MLYNIVFQTSGPHMSHFTSLCRETNACWNCCYKTYVKFRLESKRPSSSCQVLGKLVINSYNFNKIFRFLSDAQSLKMMEKLYAETYKNRSRPCLQCSQDEMRIFLYDTATAANDTDHIQPLLLRRHNVVPGMFLVSS